MIKLKQIEAIFQGLVKVGGFSANGASTVVTTALTTAVTTAGKGGVSVPLQVSTDANTIGVVTNTSSNRVKLINPLTEQEFRDGNNNEVYGKLTHSAGVYTLTYFVNNAGAETAYTFSSATTVDFYFKYRFDAARLPDDFAVSFANSFDQSGNQSATIRPVFERLTVTGTNTVSNISFNPINATAIELVVNEASYSALGGASAAFSVSNKAITWSQTNAKFALETTDVVEARYFTTE